MNWQYEGKFWDTFEDSERNLVAQLYCTAYRGKPWVYLREPEENKKPAENLTQMLERLKEDVEERLSFSYTRDDQRTILNKILRVMNTPEGHEYARFIAKREKRPEVEKQAVKQERAEEYKDKALAKKAPSMKQIQLLKKLGYNGPVGSMLDASRLIDEHLGGKQ